MSDIGIKMNRYFEKSSDFSFIRYISFNPFNIFFLIFDITKTLLFFL